MPTKRTRHSRKASSRVTPERVAAFRRGLELRDHYLVHRRSHLDCTHGFETCPEYDAYLEVLTVLRRGLPPILALSAYNPLEVDDGDPPEYCTEEQCWEWREMQDMRAELIRLSGPVPQRA
jgi:hypothetical protein